jgi:ATP-dependent Clp protease ATP-binding subunit ClpC
LHRAIQKYLEDPLAEEILNMSIKSGDTLIASLDSENGKIVFKIISQIEPASEKAG